MNTGSIEVSKLEYGKVSTIVKLEVISYTSDG